MNIAIIGTGNVGKALGTSFKRAGHSVIYASKSGTSATAAAGAAGGIALGSAREAADHADVVVLAIPYASAAQDVAREIASAVAGKVVIDATNPLKADGTGLATEGGPFAAENFASWMPRAKLVKAFNTLFASIQGNPKSHGVEVDALFATDDESARTTVAQLVGSMCFRPVYVGPLARARELEAMGYLNIALQMSAGGDWRTSFSHIGAPKASLENAPAGAEARTSNR
jgi:hypothetical protein